MTGETSSSPLDTGINEIVRDFSDGGQRAVVLRQRLRELVELSRAVSTSSLSTGALAGTSALAPTDTPQSQGENRRHLTALVVAHTKLSTAARLVREVRTDLLGTFAWEQHQAVVITRDIDAYAQSVTSAIELIP